MVVWLRGDEPLCTEFNLEANAVMQQLGIKRSRLTQISGRELRVARIRRGRYVSPVYRQCDVDEYADWTRATATHLKASGVLTDAAAQLESSSERLAMRVEQATDAVAGVVHDVVARTSGRIVARIEQELSALRREQESERQRSDSLLRETNLTLRNVREACATQQRLIDSLLATVTLLTAELRESAASLRILHEQTQIGQTLTRAQIEESHAQLRAAVSATSTSPSLAQLKRLSREKPRARRRLECGNARDGQTSDSGAWRTDHSKNRGSSVGCKRTRRQSAKRRPSQPRP